MPRQSRARPQPHLDHARMHPVQCQAPGLFRPLKRGQRKTHKLDIRLQYAAKEYRFWGPEPLGADDLRVLLANVAICGPTSGRALLPVAPPTDTGKALQADLFGESAKTDTIACRTTIYAIAREAGWNTKSTRKRKQIIESFVRLGAVSVYTSDARYLAGPIRLAAFLVDKQDGRIWFALHPMGALVLFGGDGIATALVSLVEARTLKADAALILYLFLASWIGPGHSQIIGIDALCSHIWPDRTSGDTQRQHRTRARKALAEIAKLPAWHIDQIGRETWRIRRGALPRLVDAARPKVPSPPSRSTIPTVTMYHPNRHAPEHPRPTPNPLQ